MSSTLFAGGSILTMSAPGRVEALAVRDGRILAAGSLDRCRASLRGSGHDEIDLAGRCLVPGFVDAHTHPIMYGMCAAWVDVSPHRVASIDELVRTLTERASVPADGEPVRAFGYHQEHLAEGRHPTATDLDRVATDRPVQVMHTSGHGFVVNRFTLHELGLDRDTPSPPGGEIGRGDDGELDGRLWDSACDLVTGPGGIKVTNHGPNLHLPQTDTELTSSLRLAERALLRVGITSVADAQVTGKEMGAYIRAHEADRLQLRVHALVLSSLLPELEHLGLVGSLGDAHLQFLGMKLYADGSLTAGTAYVPGGYQDPCHHGHTYHDPDELSELIGRGHAMGLQTGTHAQGPEAIELALRAIERAQRSAPRPDARHRIEHCGLPTRDQISRMRDLGVVPVGQPQHVTSYGDGVLDALGDIGLTYTPYGWFRDEGLPVVLSSDAPVVQPNPMEAIAAAVRRCTDRGTQMGGPELRLTVEEALRGYTYGGAYAIRREHDLGSLEVGKRADTALLDRDPLEVTPEELATIEVVETRIDGRVVS